MKQQLKPNAELDLLTKEELRATVGELLSGYLRPPERIRSPHGFVLDNTGASAITGVYRVEAGMRAIITRIEFDLDGFSMRNPYNPSVQGGVDIYADGQWRDGFPFGASTGFIIPAVYTESRERAIVIEDGALLQIAIAGGPASGGFTINVCGILTPMQPVI